jgi:2'-5' RNA ligase
MRLFVGIPLDNTVVGELAAVVSRFHSQADKLRWTAPESWHITLQFLGNAEPEQLDCLSVQLREVRSAPAPVQLGELGFFDRAGVFFVDVALSPALIALHQHVIAATNACGFVADTRPFHPHITLARAKDLGRAAQLRELRKKILSQPAFSRFAAHEFLLYQSHLSAEGSQYEVLRRFPLANREP